MSAMVAVWVTPAPVAVTVTLVVSAVALLLAVKVRVELPLPGAAMELGLKLAVTPEGSPETERATEELKPPLIVVEMVLLPVLLCATDRLAGIALTAKSGVACFQTSEIGVALAALPT